MGGQGGILLYVLTTKRWGNVTFVVSFCGESDIISSVIVCHSGARDLATKRMIRMIAES